MTTLGLVQARMSSRRFPGKVLAPLAGKPIVLHVLERVATVVGRDATLLITSTHASDDPLARFAASEGYHVHRGSLDDTVERAKGALRSRESEWFFRVCADSPLLDPALMRRALARAAPAVDLVTNVHPRSFPQGRSVELVKTSTFLAMEPSSADEREHMTLALYRNASRYRIDNIVATAAEAALPPLAIDTVDDLHRVEALLAKGDVR